jgi:hypothetical protein
MVKSVTHWEGRRTLPKRLPSPQAVHLNSSFASVQWPGRQLAWQLPEVISDMQEVGEICELRSNPAAHFVQAFSSFAAVHWPVMQLAWQVPVEIRVKSHVPYKGTP